MGFNPEEFFLPEAVSLLSHLIQQNEGNEILAIGRTTEGGLVFDVKLAAMGNSYSVPGVVKAASPGDVLIHNHPTGNIRPSDADISLSSYAAEKGIGSYIVDNTVSRVFPIVKWLPPEKGEAVPVEMDEIGEILREGGILQQSYPAYEHRDPQRSMAEAVTDAINRSSLVAVEAGTGTGKSFAYLIPALLFVRNNPEKKVVVSTSTIALEEQLIEKDIPFLKEHLDIPEIRAVLLKGRGNYICLRRYDLFRRNNMQTAIVEKVDHSETIEEIDQWINLPHDGSRSSMNTALGGEVWAEINCDEHSCERARCRRYENCFFYRSRRRANSAHVILINHHLLMADVSLKEEDDKSGILPAFQMLVVDEAHNLFKSAISFLGETVSTYAISFILKRLFNHEKSKGILIRLLDLLRDKKIIEQLENQMRSIAAFIPLYQHSILTELKELLEEEKESTLQLDPFEKRQRIFNVFERVTRFLDELSSALSPVSKKIKDLIQDDPMLRTKEDELFNSYLVDLNGMLSRLHSINDFLNRFFGEKSSENSVFWGERGRRGIFKFTITPLQIQQILARNIYDKVESIVFSSATLSTGKGDDGFSFFLGESGLNLTTRDIKLLQLPGCFDYKSNLRIFIPADIPDPNSPHFETETLDLSKKLISASDGGALLLFTSIRHREKARESFTGFSRPVFCQGERPAQALIKMFRDDHQSSLLATDLFWEGIDLKGDTLRNLILFRLPFRFPSHPFIKRYVDLLEKRTGKSGFTLFTLPNAIIKFKQGIGRLIRTKSDRGTITVLDRRVIGKSYGREFLKALPEESLPNVRPSKAIPKEIGDFFNTNRL